MRGVRWQIILGVSLLLLSAAVYVLHFAIFRDAHHIFLYLIGDVAFVFIEVLLVTMIIHQLMSSRDKRVRFEKLNMVIGAFFSEVGTRLLTYLSDFDPKLETIRRELLVTDDWSDKRFSSAINRLRDYDYRVEIHKVDLQYLRDFLVEKRGFLLRLLENPSLLEHEAFTELLRAVFHVTEELESRETLSQLPESDYKHLGTDIRRVYTRLVHEWLRYMKHLKNNYPYLFSLAMRLNPFDQSASPIVSSETLEQPI
jgi:hypothetical protein